MTNFSRRAFLKRQFALGACLTAGLDMVSTRVHAADMQGYRALVCVYLMGGNDSFNMFIPMSASAHQDYADVRKFIAVPRSRLLPVTPATYSDGQAYGFHPAMTGVQRMFGNNQLALIANAGPLIRPITKAEYDFGSAPVPDQLFSHSNQQDSWQAGDGRGSSGLGWAGKTIDIMYPNGAPQPSPSISVGGRSLWQTGRRVRSFEVGIEGVSRQYLPYHDGPMKIKDAFRAMHEDSLASRSLLSKEHAQTLDRANAFGNNVNTALEFAPGFGSTFRDEPLSEQLKMVAKLIAVRDRMDAGLNRQVFFVRIGGWDTHSNQVQENSNKHANLLGQLDRALSSFNSAMIELGENQSVTTFTATEFGRTLTPNGSGTDHGWGGHNIVMGGAVAGGDIYGKMPQISRNSPDAIKGGRIIPTTSVEQYSATMARWFGLNNSELATVFPNLGNFPSSNMGFMG